MTAARAMTSNQSRVASSRDGQVTFRSSPKTSPKNPKIEKRLDGANRISGLARFCAIGSLIYKAGQRRRSRYCLCVRHAGAGQYFRSVIRSGVLRLFFSV